MTSSKPSGETFLAGDPKFEIPTGLKAGTLVTSDGVELRYAICKHISDNKVTGCKGTVCIIQGRGEFIERYYEIIQDLSAKGYATAILDCRGQGGSQRILNDPLKGHISNFENYDIDLEAFVTKIVMPDCPPPYYAIGHSTGGIILLRAIRKHIWFSKAILTAPLLALHEEVMPVTLIRFLARILRFIGFSHNYVPGQLQRVLNEEDYINNKLTSDIGRFNRDCRVLHDAPQLGIAGPTIGWLHAAFNAMENIWTLQGKRQGKKELLAPALIIAAGRDRIVDTEACRAFGRTVPGAACVVINESRHDIMRESNEVRRQFWAAFDSFIESHDAAPQSPDDNAATS